MGLGQETLIVAVGEVGEECSSDSEAVVPTTLEVPYGRPGQAEVGRNVRLGTRLQATSRGRQSSAVPSELLGSRV
jgi:hypothetical protein